MKSVHVINLKCFFVFIRDYLPNKMQFSKPIQIMVNYSGKSEEDNFVYHFLDHIHIIISR